LEGCFGEERELTDPEEVCDAKCVWFGALDAKRDDADVEWTWFWKREEEEQERLEGFVEFVVVV